jgi:trans-aconitate methyltransferase
MSRLQYWKHFIETSDIDVLAKDLNFYWDPIAKRYTSYHKIEDKLLNELKKQVDLKGLKVLDYGCGLGRNLQYLKDTFNSVLGYDLDEMIKKGRELDLPVETTSDWNRVKSFSADLIFDCTVFQHMDINILIEKLISLSTISSYLYSHTRVYNDTNRDFRNARKGINLFSLIYSLNVFKPIACTIDYNDALNKQDETHYSVIYKILK